MLSVYAGFLRDVEGVGAERFESWACEPQECEPIVTMEVELARRRRLAMGRGQISSIWRCLQCASFSWAAIPPCFFVFFICVVLELLSREGNILRASNKMTSIGSSSK